jgi:Flp pilus assembly protein TadD
MALARNGEVNEGIKDLTVYVTRNPDSSVAYTKRGVRYLWIGDDHRAQADFQRALQLDPANAEAHDDLGVILARRGDFTQALSHFQHTVTLDPSYIKGYHNLAMVYHITGQDTQALDTINKALRLAPQERDSMLLKAEILERLGGAAEAAKLRQDAEFLPEGNWSERLSVQ